MFRKLVATLAFAPSLAIAAGPADGIYACTLSAPGLGGSIFVTINGQPNGDTIFAVAAVAEFMPIYGYGIGRVEGNRFRGNTNFGLPFDLVVAPTTITGTVRVETDFGQADGAASCLKIF